MDSHPLADLFPPLSEADLVALTDDIAANGLLHPIVVFQGKILDGRHRRIACGRSGVTPRFEEFPGDEAAAVEYVRSVNLLRRHMSTSQKAMIAVKLAALVEGLTQREAANQMGISRRQVSYAAEVVHRGVPELVDGITRGDLTVGTARDIVRLSPAEQVLALNRRIDRRSRRTDPAVWARQRLVHAVDAVENALAAMPDADDAEEFYRDICRRLIEAAQNAARRLQDPRETSGT